MSSYFPQYESGADYPGEAEAKRKIATLEAKIAAIIVAWDAMQAANDMACSDDRYGWTPEMDAAIHAVRTPNNKDTEPKPAERDAEIARLKAEVERLKSKMSQMRDPHEGEF